MKRTPYKSDATKRLERAWLAHYEDCSKCVQGDDPYQPHVWNYCDQGQALADAVALSDQRDDFDDWMTEQNCDPSGRPWDGF